uniref:Uncharacterized protein n=1 Tax=Nelumbo nucifera TaxID=4432 RepID=A0A822Z9C6_NELNU|nr:TPA_asm: hypothetical protein HUJ06_008779 [Nelumbo nucifera]
MATPAELAKIGTEAFRILDQHLVGKRPGPGASIPAPLPLQSRKDLKDSRQIAKEFGGLMMVDFGPPRIPRPRDQLGSKAAATRAGIRGMGDGLGLPPVL